jgi:hypothetical protein
MPNLTVDEVLSRFYGRPVVAGFTNGGWPVVRPADDLTKVLDGGVGGTLAPAVLELIELQGKLQDALHEFDRTTRQAQRARAAAAEAAEE